MKTFLLSLLLWPSIIFSQTIQNNKDFSIKGTFSGLPDGAEVKITSDPEQKNVITKGTVKAGTFTLNGMVPEPGLYFIVLGPEKPKPIFLENSNIKISGSQKDINNLRIEGSQSHNDFVQLMGIFDPIGAQLNTLMSQINQTSDQKEREQSIAKLDSIINIFKIEIGKYVAAKPSSFVSLLLMEHSTKMYDEPLLWEQHFNKLNAIVRNSETGNRINELIQFHKVGAVGTNALEFSQADVNGKPISLSSFKGKYVLIDFWASWCKPCREENPNVVKAYQKFNSKNFTVLGVSLDKDKDAWVKAIQNDGLNWTQVSDLQLWSNAVAVMYRVQGIPQNFLIDPSGKIVAKNLRGVDLENKLCELLGCN